MDDIHENPSLLPERGDVSMVLDDQLCFALYAAARGIQRLYRPLLHDLGLTYPQYLVLLVLWEEDALTISQIGDRLELKSATLTPLLKRMEQGGLLIRSRSESDERHVTVTTTPKGQKLKGTVQLVTNHVTCTAEQAATDSERLISDLKNLNVHLIDATT